MTSVLGRYDAVVCDLDGVVYRGKDAVPHAVRALSDLTVPVVYATNNASRTPADVALHLERLGVPCREDQVVTSSDAAAWLLSRDLDGGSVLCVGGAGVGVAVRAHGFTPVAPSDADDPEQIVAVVQGYGPDVRASDLAQAAYAVEAGARWVATNTDGTLPTERGIAPGNGTLIAAVQRAVGRGPDVVAGKPESPLYDLAAERLGVDAAKVLAVGDRLETDIEGAHAAGLDSVLVLTGVDDLEAALSADGPARPTVVVPDLRWLQAPRDPSVEDLREALAAAYQARDSGTPSEAESAADQVRHLLSRAHSG